MSEDNASNGSGFARVFRHELAAIQDRRRSQRIEALRQLSAAGDYSRTAVSYAVTAAEQEATLAHSAADVAEQAAKLTDYAYRASHAVEAAEQAGEDVSREEIFKQLHDAAKTLRTIARHRYRRPEDTPADETTLRAEDASGIRVREYADEAAKVLERKADALTSSREAQLAAARETVKVAMQVLRFASPTREAALAAAGTPEAVHERSSASRQAARNAERAAAATSQLGKQINKAAAFNTAAGVVSSSHAMVELLPEDGETAREAVVAEALAVADAAYDALCEMIQSYPKLQRLSNTLSQVIQGIQSRTTAPLNEILPPLKDLLKQASKICGAISTVAYVELSAAPDSVERRRRITKLRALLADPTQPAAKGYAEVAKDYVDEAVRKLSEQAIEAVGWAWRAEKAAAVALHEAAVVLGRLQPLERPDLKHVRIQALDLELAGLAFSGGGIRSATFGLGVLQALGQMQLLRFFDYFSTVSGGGYIGSWLAAWVHREGSLTNVAKQLDPSRVVQAKGARIVKKDEEKIDSDCYRLSPDPLDEEPEPIHHLRAYSRYLTPRPGIFSADTWTFIAIYLRNLLINLAVLLPWTLAVVLATRLLIWGFTLPDKFLGGWGKWGIALVFVGTVVWLGCWLYGQRTRVQQAAESANAHPEGADRVSAQDGCLLLCGVLLMTLTSLWMFSYSPPANGLVVRLRGHEAEPFPLRHPYYLELNHDSWIADWPSLAKFSLSYAVGGAVLSLLANLVGKLWYSSNRKTWKLVGWDVCLGLGLGATLSLALFQVVWPLGTDSAAIVTFGVPALLLALILADYTEILLVGKWMDELEREWRSRLGAVLFMIAAGWLVFFGATLYLPWALEQITDHPDKRAAVFAAVAAGWAMISTLSGWAGRWLQAGTATRRTLPWLRLLVLVGPPIFLVGLLAGVAMLVPLFPPHPSEGILPPQGERDPLNIACDPTLCAGMKWSAYLLLSCFFIVLFRNTVDVNRNSMHLFYANRLIRCYLGASRRKRKWRQRVVGPIDKAKRWFWLWETGSGGAPTNADSINGRIARREPTFSDFDPADDLLLQDLVSVGPAEPERYAEQAPVQPDDGYRGPYPLLNTTLNLVADSDLALQDRKADSFVLTPDFCGSKATGYARLPSLDEELSLKNRGHLTLGRAMTISGAAVDPNMGVGQSPPLTALMTVLNTRLGWWMQNPAYWGDQWDGSGPKVGSLVIRELFGQTNAESEYIHLSDGGHFENLGVYELIRRRCRFIVVADVTPDRHAASDNLGNLLRLIRTDFGISIDLDTGALAEGPDGSTRWHCAIGLIHYEDVDPGAVAGLLIYLRASLTGDESPDVRQYADSCPPFPHQPTLDQFYSEAQLESYRALGYHVAREVFAASAETMNRSCCAPLAVQAEVRNFFAHVRQSWFPSPPESDKNFPATARLYLDLEKNLRSEERFRQLRRELYPELPDAPPPTLPAPAAGRDPSTEMFMVAEMLQVMELAWFGMKLDDYYAHPLNHGWMSVMRRWTNSPTFHGYWPLLRGEFSQDFVTFCERALNMVPLRSEHEQLDKAGLAKWLTDLQEMDQEFKNEWDSERDRLRWLTNGRYLRNAVATAVEYADELELAEPLVWFMWFSYGAKKERKRTCGLVAVSPAFRGAAAELELLVWLRGPYRNLSIGRSRLQRILPQILGKLSGRQAPTGSPLRLHVYYPVAGINQAERLEQMMWRNFFFDFGFRSVRPNAMGNFPGVITLARELR